MQNNNYTFSQKAQQVLCSQHRNPILYLEIGPDTLIGNRLLCSRCDAFQKPILNFNQVDKKMEEWKSDEEKKNQEIKQKFFKIMSSFKQAIKDQEKLIEEYVIQVKQNLTHQVEYWKNGHEKYMQDFEAKFQKNQETKFQQIYKQYSSSPLTRENLQNVAIFLSEEDQRNSDDFNIERLTIFNEKYQSYIDRLTNDLQQYIQTKSQDYVIAPQISVWKELKITQDNKKTYFTENVMDIQTIAISRDDKLLASADKSGLIILWEIETKKLIQQYKELGEINNLIFSNDNKLLVANQLKSPYDIMIFDLTYTASLIPRIKLDGHAKISQNIDNSIRRIQLTHDSKYLISAVSEDKALMIWDLEKLELANLIRVDQPIYGMSISNNQSYISVCCKNGIAQILDSWSKKQEKQKYLVKWQAHDQDINGTIFTQDSKMVVTSNSQIKIWSIDSLLSNNNKIPFKTFLGAGPIWNLDILENGQVLVIYDGRIKIWNLNDNKLLVNLEVADLNEREHQENKNYAVTSNRKLIFIAFENKVQIQEITD